MGAFGHFDSYPGAKDGIFRSGDAARKRAEPKVPGLTRRKGRPRRMCLRTAQRSELSDAGSSARKSLRRSG